MNDLDPEDVDPTEFATDTKHAVAGLTEHLDLEGEVGGMPLPMVRNLLLPAIEERATTDEESTKQALALLSLEAKALLNKHDDRSLEELAQ